MAQKKSEEPKVASTEETDTTIEANEKTQKEAENVASGSTSKNKKYKLKDPSTSYSEPNFTLVGDETKSLPEDPSDQLIERIRAGYIVEA